MIPTQYPSTSPNVEAISLSDLFLARLQGDVSKTNPISPVQFIGQLEVGVTGTVLKPLTMHIPKPIILEAVATDSTNFSKLMRKKRLSRHQTEELNSLTNLWSELMQFFAQDEETLLEWISQPIPALEGQAPMSFMGSQFGRETIRNLLNVMRTGDFG